jgi:hypothetical protein
VVTVRTHYNGAGKAFFLGEIGRMTKRRGISARRMALVEAGLGPTPERLQHGPVVRETRVLEDGARAMVWQGLDTISAMLARGSINLGMYSAGSFFHDQFRLAGLDALWSADPTRVPVQLATGTGIWGNLTGGSEAARLQIISALDALGGVRAPAGSCAWAILGCEMSLNRWARTATWSSRRIEHVAASGILIAALGILEAHWAPAGYLRGAV